MKTTDYRWLFLAVLAAIVILSNFVPPATLGVSAEWSNGNYRFAGGTAPWAAGLSIIIGALYICLMYAHSDPPAKPMPGIFRRFIAFWIDFVLAIMATAPVLGFIPALSEWRRTGGFQWNFDRTIPEPSDTFVAAVTLFLLFAALVAYFVIPLLRRRPSPGSCVAGYQITIDDGSSMTIQKAILRTLAGFVAVATAYLAPFIARDRKRGKFWLDAVFGTRAVKLR